MANNDHFLHSNTLFNWLLCSIMSAGSRKCIFWTSHLRFSTRKPPVNIGHSRFSKTFSSFDHLVFTQEIVWKPSVTSPFYLSHVWKLLVPLSPPFSVTVYKSNVKLQQRHLWPVFNINQNCTHPPNVMIRYFLTTGPKLTFSESRRHDSTGQPIEKSVGMRKVVIISHQSLKKKTLYRQKNPSRKNPTI